MNLFPEVLKLLKFVKDEGVALCKRTQAKGLLTYFKTLDFVFYLHLLEEILGLAYTLSRHLQKKYQNILEADSLVNGTKRALKAKRANGFDAILNKVSSFCQKHNIHMVKMSDPYVTSRNRRTGITNEHHFKVDIYNTVLDMQIQKFSDRFSEISTVLLANMAALSPCDSFSMFDVSKLVKLSKMYPQDFDDTEMNSLPDQLTLYYHTVQEDVRFANLNGIADLARLMVKTERRISFPLVYRLLKLTLVLPIATSTVERCFSQMKLLKSSLRNRMRNNYMNGALICAIEKEALEDVPTKVVIDNFQGMRPRKGQLP